MVVLACCLIVIVLVAKILGWATNAPNWAMTSTTELLYAYGERKRRQTEALVASTRVRQEMYRARLSALPQSRRLVYCNRCGSAIPDDADFCGQCGVRVGNGFELSTRGRTQ